MASSKTNCEFCDTTTDLKWKCDDCNLSLCELCSNKLHTKIPALFEHVIEDTKDPRNEDGENTKPLDLKLVQCLQHTEKKCFAYCTSCNKSLCTDCLVKPHQYEKLNAICSERKEQLINVKNKIEEDLPFFSENVATLRTMKTEHQEKYDQIKQQILTQEEEMKDSIANKTILLIKELDDYWKPHSDQISKMEETMITSERDLVHRKATIEEALKSEDMTSIFSAADQVVKELPVKIVAEIKKQKSLIFSTEKSTKNLHVGSLMKIPELKVVNTYACDAVNQLATVNSDLYVGFNHSKNTLELLVLTKTKCYTVNSEDNDQPICDITVTADESILFTENGKSSIVYQYKVNAEITEFLDISPMRVRAIHANTNGEKYFVGFMDSIGPFLPPSVKSHRGVKILNATGNIIQTIELENDKFSLPNVITTNINGDICVIDSLATNWDGRVIVLEYSGKFKWIYQGHSGINTEHSFSPRDIVTISTGDIFVSDRKSCAVHVLSIDGIFKTSIGEKEGIQSPWSLTIDQENRMLIGGSSKIHVVDIENS
ncbi:E3 ubiquitin-protein ligase TRIM71-like [Mytilus edulis]|uniref:E3 ubiquitin-protein ligase TRIM71-like n=1 Tax=Mytilus edulis TaxID=6550 RepID=UPI0039EFBF92